MSFSTIKGGDFHFSVFFSHPLTLFSFISPLVIRGGGGDDPQKKEDNICQGELFILDFPHPFIGSSYCGAPPGLSGPHGVAKDK